MMKMGVVKPMAVASAIVMCGIARNHRHSPAVCTPPRRNWPPMLLGRQASRPERSMMGTITASPMK